MKKALIDPTTTVYQVIGWDNTVTPPKPIFQEIPNSDRVAEVLSTPFEVAAPLFWVDCVDEAVADVWYFNTVTRIVTIIPDPPAQPNVVGAQTV